MAVESRVKFFQSGMGGLTGLFPFGIHNVNDQNGCQCLDALLVDGFNTVTFDSIVISGGIATATRSAGNHGFIPYQVILVSGVTTPAALNDEWRVIDTTSNTITFAVAGIPDQTATGAALTIKTPPLGWERVFTATQKRVFRSTNQDECARSFFRFQEAQTTMLWDGYENMTDIDNGTGRWTYDANYSGCLKCGSYPWLVVGDDKTFYVFFGPGAFYWGWNNAVFGAFKSFLPNDVDNDIMGAGMTSGYANTCCSSLFSTYSGYGNVDNGPSMRRRAMRDAKCLWRSVSGVAIISGHESDGPTYPDPFSNSLFILPHMIRERGHSGDPIRGIVRGCYWVNHRVPMSPPQPSGIDMDDVAGLEGRRVKLLSVVGWTGSTVVGARAAIDVTGPWD